MFRYPNVNKCYIFILCILFKQDKTSKTNQKHHFKAIQNMTKSVPLSLKRKNPPEILITLFIHSQTRRPSHIVH